MVSEVSQSSSPALTPGSTATLSPYPTPRPCTPLPADTLSEIGSRFDKSPPPSQPLPKDCSERSPADDQVGSNPASPHASPDPPVLAPSAASSPSKPPTPPPIETMPPPPPLPPARLTAGFVLPMRDTGSHSASDNVDDDAVTGHTPNKRKASMSETDGAVCKKATPSKETDE